ncbi:MAG: non-homologous end-joining DNA ligase [Verrucomicrobiota bacterium]|nr:non-homologous end-joining DNA ligase [Verrucomicrobiota bacterium]
MAKQQQQVTVDGRELTISNVEKLYFPESGFTKGEVVAFYSEIADAILPHLRDRPLTLKRYPEGINAEHFYEKNAPKYKPDWVETFAVPRTEREGDINYVLCNDRATLIWATNLADIEKHVLLARAPNLDQPTSIVFDLDPGEPAGMIECGEIALHLKKVFEAWGLESFVKVSGSKGLHLSVPLNCETSYEVTQPFAKTVAELVAHEMPKRVVSEMSKSIRGGKVFIDWSQNSDFKTTVCVYSMRAKSVEPFISMPVTWNELARAVKRKDAKRLSFTPDAAIKRIAKEGDLFEPVLKLRQELPSAFTKALAAGPKPKLSRWPRNDKRSTRPNDKSLREYAAKREFTRTPEPAASAPAPNESKGKGPHRFVIQKHAASHLHYDFRLEMQGVLRSWAVPKGPPTELRKSRLAMHVEDHPLDYGTFEGTIPPGNYGAGTVMLWDEGVYQDITGNDAAAFHAGKMHIVMQGQKLKGEWILVKDKREPESNRWLLIKAGESMKPFTPKLDDKSATTGRTMAQIAKDNDAQWQSNRPPTTTKRAPKASPAQKPRFVEPMKCKPVTELPNESNWTFEIKFDGYRCIAVKEGEDVRLFSRNENLLNDRFPNVVAALRELPGEFAIDGEIVALDEQGRPSFQLLQNNLTRPLDVFFYAFDLLNRDGQELLLERIERRRELLDNLLGKVGDPLRRSPLLEAPAHQVLDAVRKLGLEGVVGKRGGSIYEPGERSGAWIKQRTNAEQDFVIGGYKPGTRGFDSLLVGVYRGNELIFVARAKNGFVPRLREEIFAKFKGLEAKEWPFANLPEKKGARRGDALTAEKMKECRWLKPKLVCRVSFVEWTDAGNLRHANFVAMRDDADPRDVVRET